MPNRKKQGSLCRTRKGRFGRGVCLKKEEAREPLPNRRCMGVCANQGEAGESMPKKGEAGVSLPVNERQGSVFQTPRGKGMYSKQGEAGQSIPSTTCKGSHCQPLTSTPQQQQN